MGIGVRGLRFRHAFFGVSGLGFQALVWVEESSGFGFRVWSVGFRAVFMCLRSGF